MLVWKVVRFESSVRKIIFLKCKRLIFKVQLYTSISRVKFCVLPPYFEFTVSGRMLCVSRGVIRCNAAAGGEVAN